MSMSAVAAAGTALALYLYGRRGGVCGGPAEPTETHVTVHSAPTTLMEDIFFLAEGLRYTYGETLARWRTADLLIGLAYLCRKDPEEHPVADIAQQGCPFGRGLAAEQWPEALTQLRNLERYFRYCSGLRERRPLPQRHYFRTMMDVTDADLLMQELRAGVLKPSFVLIRDRQLKAVVLAIRGTHSFKDMFTSLTGASKPHHLVDANGVVLGYSHFGMLAAARWIKGQTRQRMEQALADNPGYRLKIIGHSLGGGTAALLTMMLREEGGPFADVTCVAIACPSCMTLELAQSCSDYVTTVVHNADVIPTICPGSADALREEVMRSSWFGEFRRDVRASGIVRAVENGIRDVGSATLNATSWTTSKLAACYQRGSFGSGTRRRQPLKRRNSDDSLAATAAAEEAVIAAVASADPGGEADALGEALPLSASAPAGSSINLFAAVAAEETETASGDGGQVQLGGSSWGQRVSQQLSGRGAAVLSGTSQMLQSTSGILRNTSGLLMRRMWPVGRSEAEHDGGDGTAAATAATEDGGRESRQSAPAGAGAGGPLAAADAADAAPGPIEIDDDLEAMEGEEEELYDMQAEVADGQRPSSHGELRISYQERWQMRVQLQLERTGSLEEEVSLRMHEVQQAVHDAEAEEQASGRDDSTVPAVIRPGGYGISGTSSSLQLSPSKLDPRWKRQMYPAGRILHLVPARLVPGTVAHAVAAATAAAAAAAQNAKLVAAAADAAGCEQQSAGPAPARQGGADAHMGAVAAAGMPASVAVADCSSARRNSTPGTKHAAKLSVSDFIASEEMMGHRSSDSWADVPGGSGGGNVDGGRQQAGAGLQAQEQEEMLLLDNVPQEAYARIKLCRTVLSDHVIPNYLKSLESALECIRQHAEVVPDGLAAATAAAGDTAIAVAAPVAPLAEAAGAGNQAAATVPPLSPGGSPAAAAAAAALRSAAAKASFGRGSKQD